MVQASSPGRAQHKSKTLDVEVNLLAERIQERERLLDALSKRAIAGLLVLAFGAFSLPAAYRLQDRAAQKASQALEAAALVQRELAERQTILTSAKPAMQETQMLESVRGYSSNLLLQLSGFLNAATDKMALSTLKVEVIGGTMKVSGRADAESYAVARDFVAKLAKLPGTNQVTLKKWYQNPEFARNGVTFEVDHSAQVGGGQ